ncbi:MAG: hypothetical protein JWL59_2530 [Chthoniobacteraceae bacterium]|nr:hypothetical protein [Chthoniobacteraceae bacterium]
MLWVAHGQTANDAVLAELKAEIAALRGPDPVLPKLESAIATLKAGGLRLSEADFDLQPEQKPPPMIEAAGPEFVAAWREFRRAASLRKKLVPDQWGLDIRSHDADAVAGYARLLRKASDDEALSQPEDFPQLKYVSGFWCGTEPFNFEAYNNRMRLLFACVRNRRFGDAFELLSASGTLGKGFMSFVEALGFDSQKILLGAWLHGNPTALETFSQNATDASARLILRWAKLHVKEVAALGAGHTESKFRKTVEPQVPGRELLNLLRPTTAVSMAAKEEIAAFINSEEVGLRTPRYWLGNQPAAGLKWLKPIARVALLDGDYDTRQCAEQVLVASGEGTLKTELSESVRFRLLLNGKQWGSKREPGFSGLKFNVNRYPGANSPGMAWNARVDGEGIISNSDGAFIPPSDISRAYIYSLPSEVPSPADPWFCASVPLPPRFGQVTELKAETVEVTIRPRLPRPDSEYARMATEVEFGWAADEAHSRSTTRIYRVQGSEPLVLSMVQPGAYLLGMRVPGSVVESLQPVTVNKTATVFEPAVLFGSTVTVPLDWPAQLTAKALEPQLIHRIGEQTFGGLWGILQLMRNGEVFDFPLEDEDSGWVWLEHKIVMRNLPLGKYRLMLHSSEEARGPDLGRRRYPGWKKAEVSFEVGAATPPQLTLKAVKVVPAPR